MDEVDGDAEMEALLVIGYDSGWSNADRMAADELDTAIR